MGLCLKQYRSRPVAPTKRLDPRTRLRSSREERYASAHAGMRYRRRVRAAFFPVLAAILLSSFGCGGSTSGSVGAVFGRDNDTRALYVREVPKGLAAAGAGLLPGDQVVMIEGLYVRDLDAKSIREKLRGDVGSTVALTILRGEEVIHVRVARGALRDHEAISPKETRFRE
jgi:predicted metalloprotease with PDZ domain